MLNNNNVFNIPLPEKTLFKDAEKLGPNYLPNKVLSRDTEMQKLITHLSPILRNRNPGHIFIYGVPGCGKTAVTKYLLLKQLPPVVQAMKLNIHTHIINCKFTNTPSQILVDITNAFALPEERVNKLGLAINIRINTLVNLLNAIGGQFVIVLDEVDSIPLTHQDILYTLTRLGSESANLVNASLCIVGISNDLQYFESLDGRIKSSLGKQELVFPPYTAPQLTAILKERAKIALKPNVVEEGVISLCAAISAQEHGDARLAIDLLRIASEIAESEESNNISVSHMQKAKVKIEYNKYAECIKTLPPQSKIILLSILKCEFTQKNIYSGDVYRTYTDVCNSLNAPILSQRRTADLISQLDTVNIITQKLKFRGRLGRTQSISLSLPSEMITNILAEDPYTAELTHDITRRHAMQQRL